MFIQYCTINENDFIQSLQNESIQDSRYWNHYKRLVYLGCVSKMSIFNTLTMPKIHFIVTQNVSKVENSIITRMKESLKTFCRNRKDVNWIVCAKDNSNMHPDRIRRFTDRLTKEIQTAEKHTADTIILIEGNNGTVGERAPWVNILKGYSHSIYDLTLLDIHASEHTINESLVRKSAHQKSVSSMRDALEGPSFNMSDLDQLVGPLSNRIKMNVSPQAPHRFSETSMKNVENQINRLIDNHVAPFDEESKQKDIEWSEEHLPWYEKFDAANERERHESTKFDHATERERQRSDKIAIARHIERERLSRASHHTDPEERSLTYDHPSVQAKMKPFIRGNGSKHVQDEWDSIRAAHHSKETGRLNETLEKHKQMMEMNRTLDEQRTHRRMQSRKEELHKMENKYKTGNHVMDTNGPCQRMMHTNMAQAPPDRHLANHLTSAVMRCLNDRAY